MQTVYCQVSNNDWVSRTAAIDYMVVAGGGGSGSKESGGPGGTGGGGAGGYRASGFGPSPLRGTALELGLGTHAILDRDWLEMVVQE